MAIIESVKNFIAKCPALDDLARVNVEFLGNDTNTYSIEETATQPVIRTYLDGSSERQFTFVFASVMAYSDEVKQNIENSGFFEAFASWLETCTQEGNLPVLEDGMTPYKIEAISNNFLYGVASDLQTARYQIQCRLLYDKE